MGGSIIRSGKLSLWESPVWQTSYHELFNQGWFDKIETRASLWLEIIYRKLFNEDWFPQTKI